MSHELDTQVLQVVLSSLQGSRMAPAMPWGGISGICPMVHVEDEGFEKLKETVVSYVNTVYPLKDKSFKVAARRARKNYPLNSMEINMELGGVILDTYPQMHVDVHKPDILLNVEKILKFYYL